jgi:hypothetical protein
MSVVASTHLTICNSPLNTSKAKMQFSFPKADRFVSMSRSLYGIILDPLINSMICHQLNLKQLHRWALENEWI